MSKVNKVLLAVVIILVVLVVAALVVWKVAFKPATYSAVFLRTGDLYFGELTQFPYFGLKNVYTLSLTQDAQTPISIQRFKNVFWGPEDKIKLNRDEVVWITKLDPQGQLAQLIKTNPDLLPTQQQAQEQVPAASAEEGQ
ncbi:MAG: hypothetical protein V2A55_00790 [Candidatus Jorgensenbacteria bacterium]